MKACETGNLELVKFILEQAHFDLKAKDKLQRTIIHYACKSGKIELVDYLITKKKR